MPNQVIEYLSGRGVAFTVLPLPGSHSLEETAARHGCRIEDSVRTTAYVNRFGLALTVVPARAEPDLALVRRAMDDPGARLATAREVALTFLELDPDALPPLGLLLDAPLYVDPAVADLPEVVFAAGRSSLAILIPTAALFRDDPVLIAPLIPESVPAEPARLPDPRDMLPVHLAG